MLWIGRISKNCVQALSLTKTAQISSIYRKYKLGERLLVLAKTSPLTNFKKIEITIEIEIAQNIQKVTKFIESTL